eukprot:TRINITY_DN76_c0_g1_i3.p4 TRINITY_DN76_c0_g1~~TRINITY_DN76_c0_g1_i3.p4  ORF type:complete len:213 (-),score=7.92 TRINITY_DN76_c0_g1_i3:2399-3037(-)
MPLHVLVEFLEQSKLTSNILVDDRVNSVIVEIQNIGESEGGAPQRLSNLPIPILVLVTIVIMPLIFPKNQSLCGIVDHLVADVNVDRVDRVVPRQGIPSKAPAKEIIVGVARVDACLHDPDIKIISVARRVVHHLDHAELLVLALSSDDGIVERQSFFSKEIEQGLVEVKVANPTNTNVNVGDFVRGDATQSVPNCTAYDGHQQSLVKREMI